MAIAERLFELSCRPIILGCVLLFILPAAAQPAPNHDLVVVKQFEHGAMDATFVNHLDNKIGQWLQSIGTVGEVYEDELSDDLNARVEYLRQRAPLTLHVRIVKDSQSAVVMFRIVDNAAGGGAAALPEFPYTKTLESQLIKAESVLENLMRTVLVPMLAIYQGATQGKQVLADCIRSESGGNVQMRHFSRLITHVYPGKMRDYSAIQDIGIHGLNNDQVAHICLAGDNGGTRLLSQDVAIRGFFDQIIYGDLGIGGERVYLTVENRNAPTGLHDIAIPEPDASGKADKLAREVLDLISN